MREKSPKDDGTGLTNEPSKKQDYMEIEDCTVPSPKSSTPKQPANYEELQTFTNRNTTL